MTVNVDTMNDLALNRQLCFPLYAASNLIARRYRAVLGPLGLTYPQYLVMLVLWESSPQSVGGLGEKLHLDSGTLTPLVKRLVAAGFVSRGRSRRSTRSGLADRKGTRAPDVGRQHPAIPRERDGDHPR